MFRSGRLTRARLNQIIRWVERLPHDLKAVAKAVNIYPSDLLAWYAAGQDPECKDPLMAELAWKVAEIRAEKRAENFERIVAAASVGKKVKVIEKENTNPDMPPTKEIHTEDVLPASWAIEKLDKMADASAWEIAPDNEQASELHRMMAELAPTPLLTDGSDSPEQTAEQQEIQHDRPYHAIPAESTPESNEQPAADSPGDE